MPLPNDLALEPNETFTLRLFADPAGQQYANPTTQVPIGDAEGVGTIEDNDGTRPRVTAVFVNGTGWAPQFRSAVAPGDRVDSTFGYRVPAGPSNSMNCRGSTSTRSASGSTWTCGWSRAT